MTKFHSLLLCLTVSIQILIMEFSFAQENTSFQSTGRNFSTKGNALGSNHITSSLNDISFSSKNPSLLQDSVSGQVNLYSAFLPGNSYLTSIQLGKKFNKTGNWGAFIHNIQYGEIQGYDKNGNSTTNYNASDLIIGIQKSHQINVFSLGITLKYYQSIIETYKASAIGMDIGGNFKHPEKDLVIGLLLENIGTEIESFTSIKQQLPFNSSIGISFKPEKMPIKTHITYRYLHQIDLSYKGTSNNYLFDNKTSTKDYSTTQQLLQHLTIGAELFPYKPFQILVGYDVLKGYSMRDNLGRSFSGFSFGANLNTKKFDIRYAFTNEYTGLGTNNISLLLKTKFFGQEHSSKKKRVITD